MLVAGIEGDVTWRLTVFSVVIGDTLDEKN